MLCVLVTKALASNYANPSPDVNGQTAIYQ